MVWNLAVNGQKPLAVGAMMVVAVLLLAGCSLLSSTDKPLTKDQIRQLAIDAATMLGEGGDYATLKEAPWDRADYLVWTIDGTAVYHPQDVSKENSYVGDDKDYYEKNYGYELRDTAREGGGFVDYWWIKPDEIEPTLKTLYVVPARIGTQQYLVAAGAYRS
ncbi:hypothetical protein AUJ68_07035 [Candidatus Woesearchaeota archaeon CG1_02_57_44]|nr:MAG: hypothetical protein AUJ68_07035 [Candidatus Woesearchaeota archaeon CG1_02_57_44]